MAKNSNKGPTVPTKSKESGSGGAPSFTGSKSDTRSEDETEWTLMDINGDGLPDRVYNVDNNVALNIGYSFESRECWELGEIGKNIGNAYSSSLGVGGGGKEFAGGSKSYSGGISGSKSYSETVQMLTDINGDGLPDRVVIAGERTLYVYYHTGCGYNKYGDTIVLDASDPALYNWSTTQNKGGNFGLTLGFPIVVWAKVSASAGADASFSLSSSNIQFMDMDADGYADLVIAPDEETLIIRYSNLGRTGLLKKVSNPMGGSIELTYHKTKANVFYSRRWVMDTVKVCDNFPGDGADVMLTSHEYDMGYYDRNERAFYGFAIVNEKHHDTQNDNAIYRKYNRYYYNNNFYNKGLLLTEEVSNGTGDSLYMVTMNKYNNQPLTRNSSNYNVTSKFMTVDTTIICYWEGTDNPDIRQQKTFQYENIYGRVIQQTETSTNMPVVEVSITYHSPAPSNYNVSIPQEVIARSSGQMYRKRTTEIDNAGRMVEIHDYYDSTAYPLTTRMTYGDYGNCMKMEHPGGSYFEYEYDNQVHSYPVKVTDAFNCSSFVEEYDYRFGVPLTVKDKSGHYMFYTLDQFGRTTEICAPKEQTVFQPIILQVDSLSIGSINLATDEIIRIEDFPLGGLQLSSHEVIPIENHYTVKYVYRYGNVKDTIPFSAITFNYDPANEGSNITTYTYSDGLGRIIQTKKDAAINGEKKVVISGKVEYDAFGRTVNTWYPSVEGKRIPQVIPGQEYVTPIVFRGGLDTIAVIKPHGNLEMLPLLWEDEIPPSTTEYDILDRPLIQKAPDNTLVSYKYGFGIDSLRNDTLFKTEITDQNNNISITLANVNKQQYEVRPAGHQPVWFHYSDIGDLLKVEGVDFERSYLYDILGRKTQYQEDSLKEEYTYDGMNLEEKTSYWNEQGTSQDKTIQYSYDRNRLTAVQSSEYQEAIEYFYDNDNGKLMTIKDASGTQHFQYGSMGELTKQTRIYALPFMEQAVKLETQFEYDSWGRTLNMTYPDGEVVNYEYDYGGMLKKMQGVKDTGTYTYLEDLRYDKFGAKTLVKYGNDMKTTYSYNPLNLRLTNQHISLVKQTGETNYFHASYSYDPKGNITGITSTNFKVGEFSSTETFVYDAADQLDSASGNNGSLYTLSMSYGNYGRINTSNTSFSDPKINGTTQHISTSYTYQTTGAPSNNFAPISANNGNISFEYGINGSMRKRTAPDKTEYYLYNGYDQMKAYSNNKLKYGYYNYDDAGQRMYKAVLNKVTSQTNRLGGNILEVENLMLYPNGYININQDGNYTKHYYADEARIASKIGTGFADSISGGVVGNMSAYNTMIDELGLATNDTIDNLIYAFDQIRYLGGDSNKYENGLYFYHGNHLSSTQLTTDINGDISQAVLYSPWGVVLSEYRADFMLDTIPRYLWNGKERDQESNLDYFEARYYSSDAATFQSRDIAFEEYQTFSPYHYCMNNPIKYIDPDGKRVVISYQDPGQKNPQKVYYHKGELYTDKKYNNQYTGNNKFALNVQSDLNNIASKGGELKNRLSTLVDSKNTHTITTGATNHMSVPEEAKQGAKTGSTTYYNRDPKNVSQSRSSLVHELLGHGYSADQGTLSNVNIPRGTNNLEQINAIDIQNVYNKVIGLPLRTEDKNAKGEKYDVSEFLNLNPVNE